MRPRKSLSIVPASIIILAFATLDSAAQTLPSNSPAPRSGNREAVGSDFENKLQDLINTTRRINTQLQAVESAANVGKAEPQSPSTPAAPVELGGADKASDDVSVIRQRIELLRSLKRERAESAPVTQVEANVPVQPAPRPSGTTPTATVPLDTLVEPQADSEPAERNPYEVMAAQLPPPSITATKVMQTVDPFALGQSLYQTGNYAAAHQALSAVNHDGLNQSDKTWLELLKALCERRLGKTMQAEAGLRSIANDKSSDYPVKVARWWLKHSEQTSATLPLYKEISSNVDALLERASQHE